MSAILQGFVFHHVGYASDDLHADRDRFFDLGFRQEGEEFFDPLQKIHGLFLLNNGFRLELVAPAAENSPVKGFLRRKVKLYHQAFQTTDFRVACEQLEGGGAKLCAPAAPSIAFGGRQICFYMLISGDLIELIDAGGRV